ncbi:MAG: glycolate oxidase subunit GlcE, partial [Burkholderiales bacterium]
GELLTFGGQVMKNVAGYDVSRVLVGSLGVLGVIVEVSLKVLPMAKAEATLKFELSEGEALSKLNEWGGQPLPLNASCWVEDGGLGVLFLRLRGAEAAVQAACEKLGGERIENAQAAGDWNDCREQRLPWFKERAPGQDLWRLSLPQTARLQGLPEPPLVEWHGAQRWVRAEAGEKSASRLRAAAATAGGHATLFIAENGQLPSGGGRFEPPKSPLDRIQRELKREFDPAGIFNRGRLSPDF